MSSDAWVSAGGRVKLLALSTLLRAGARRQVNAAVGRLGGSDPMATWFVQHGMHVYGWTDLAGSRWGASRLIRHDAPSGSD